MRVSIPLTNLQLTVSKVGSQQFFRLPANCELHDALLARDKGELGQGEAAIQKAEADFQHYQQQPFWEHDKGYAFIREQLLPQLHEGTSVLDAGCYAGSLPIFLQSQSNWWGRFSYSGCDVVRHALQLASEHFPEGHFFFHDLHYEFDSGDYDIVFSKGTLISAYYPDRALDNLLSLNAPRVILVHTALTTGPLSENYMTMLCSSPSAPYISTAMHADYFRQRVAEAGYTLETYDKRGSYRHVEGPYGFSLFDVVLVKNPQA